jgi:hypothetical protein
MQGVSLFFHSSQAVQPFCSIPVVSLHFVVWFLESLLTRLGPRLGHHLRRTSDFLFARAFWLDRPVLLRTGQRYKSRVSVSCHEDAHLLQNALCHSMISWHGDTHETTKCVSKKVTVSQKNA